MLIFKSKKGTIKEHPHQEVWLGDIRLGYIMSNKSGGAASIGENWNFVSNSELLQSMYAKTKKALITKINLALSDSKNIKKDTYTRAEVISMLEQLYMQTAENFNDYARCASYYTEEAVQEVEKFMANN